MKKILFVLLAVISACTPKTINLESLDGTWGSENDNSELIISEDKIAFDFTCAIAEIYQRIPQNFENPFYMEGTYTQQFGIIPENFDPSKYIYPAVFKFSLEGNYLFVEIRLKSDYSKVGEFKYSKNRKILIKKCA